MIQFQSGPVEKIMKWTAVIKSVNFGFSNFWCSKLFSIGPCVSQDDSIWSANSKKPKIIAVAQKLWIGQAFFVVAKAM